MTVETRSQTDSKADQTRGGASSSTSALGSASVENLPVTQFLWGAGVECSFIPHLNVDQFNWTQHNRFWRDDLKRLHEEVGISHLRYALPWHQIEAQRGRFDWQIADERIAECDRLGLHLVLDVMHFGTP